MTAKAHSNRSVPSHEIPHPRICQNMERVCRARICETAWCWDPVKGKIRTLFKVNKISSKPPFIDTVHTPSGRIITISSTTPARTGSLQPNLLRTPPSNLQRKLCSMSFSKAVCMSPTVTPSEFRAKSSNQHLSRPLQPLTDLTSSTWASEATQ